MRATVHLKRKIASCADVDNFKRDWFRILADLDERGFSCSDVADMLKLSDSTVRNWKYGIEPIHSKGEMLLSLHRKIVPLELKRPRKSNRIDKRAGASA